MNDQPPINTNAVWGKLSLICVLTTVALVLSGFLAAYALKIEILFWIAAAFSVFLVTLGLLSGVIGLFTRRAWLGLLLNLMIVAAGYGFYIYLFTACCIDPHPLH
jgi:hypothetical protein